MISLAVVLIYFFSACRKDDHPGQHTPLPTPGQGTYCKIKVRAAVAVGHVIYDSIPAAFTVTTWDQDGIPHRTDTVLAPGINELLLPKSHTKFRFELHKWNADKDTVILQANLKETVVYTITATKPQKMLKAEVTYNYVSGSYKPISKIDYSYDGHKLHQIMFYNTFLIGGTELFQPVKKETFTYSNNVLNKISEAYLVDVVNEPAEKFFFYNGSGNIQRVRIVYPSNSYVYRYEYSGDNNQVVKVFLERTSNPLQKHYQLIFDAGNRIEYKAIETTGNYGVSYQYDQNINPYKQLGWPENFYGRQSKNNVLVEKGFTDGQVREDVKYVYQFDSDGYVSQVIRSERDPLTNNFFITNKKEFSY